MVVHGRHARVRPVGGVTMSSKRKVCHGKKKFTTRNGAAGHVAHKQRKFNNRYRAYKCEFCKGWHVSLEEALRDRDSGR